MYLLIYAPRVHIIIIIVYTRTPRYVSEENERERERRERKTLIAMVACINEVIIIN